MAQNMFFLELNYKHTTDLKALSHTWRQQWIRAFKAQHGTENEYASTINIKYRNISLKIISLKIHNLIQC